MMYSVIIPTMWKALDQLTSMLQIYEANPLVGEILIVQNAPGIPIGTTCKKVRILNNGENLFVNPSWNLGVREATYGRVIIVNDDITFSNLEAVLKLAEDYLIPGMIIGFHRNSFKKWRNGKSWDGVRIMEPKPKYHANGFGVFMIVHRDSWHVIPDNMVVWGGDSLQFHALSPYLIEGVDVATTMGSTVRAVPEIKKYRKSDVVNFNKYMEETCIKYR